MKDQHCISNVMESAVAVQNSQCQSTIIFLEIFSKSIPFWCRYTIWQIYIFCSGSCAKKSNFRKKLLQMNLLRMIIRAYVTIPLAYEKRCKQKKLGQTSNC